jgi:Flp pilus assembly protein TadG
MTSTAFVQKLRNSLRAFRRAERGHVAITFALATIPIIGFVGSAVDYSRANSARSAMQSAVDATALMLSKDITTLTADQIGQKATAYFNAMYNRAEVAGITITPTYTPGSGAQLVVTGSGSLQTTFMRAMGLQTLNVNVSSTVKWGNTRLRVALVLDNTGSMSDAGKITALKTATNNLLTQLKNAAAQNGDVYVSIVPFVKDVNVDPVNYTQTWIDWTDWDDNNGICYNNAQFNGNPNSYTTKTTCQGGGKYWAIANHNTWNGCVTDRGGKNGPTGSNYDTNVAMPAIGNVATLFPAQQYSPCPQAVMALNYNWTAMTTLVNNMSPGGLTNQAIGLALGWMSLVGGGPFPTPPAMDSNYQYQQVIILLTDGLNTENRWYTDQASIDARQAMTCANVNAAGITLYTIQVNTGGNPTSTLLQNCAGSPGKYPDSSKFFLLTSASAMVTTFNQIGTALSNLRVSR